MSEREIDPRLFDPSIPSYYLKYRYININRKRFERVPFGEEKLFKVHDDDVEICHDCLARRGEVHNISCDSEECPRCQRQLLSCRCKPQNVYNIRMVK